MTKPVVVVVPVYGHPEMTHDLVRDLEREAELARIVIVDNGGDYAPVAGEEVLCPGSNLGWAAGTNFGTIHVAGEAEGFVWLNNDTRLSPGFVAGLLRAARDTGAGLVGPFYDCHWVHQRLFRPPGDAGRYRPRRRHYEVPFLDGTCVYVPQQTIDRIGLLDDDTFAPAGWGAEVDFSLRARQAGLRVVATRLSYLHHDRGVTARSVYEDDAGYGAQAYPTAIDGLRTKWGDGWADLAGFAADHAQTPPLTERDRVGRRFRRGTSASRFRSSRPR